MNKQEGYKIIKNHQRHKRGSLILNSFVLTIASIGSALLGASLVHSILQPDLTLRKKQQEEE